MPHNNLQDLWDSCYSQEHRKSIPPEEFRKTFCDQCMNTKCQNSKGSGTSWAKRILTQEERLLRNPQFSDPRDPQYRKISEMDFQNVLREVISIEIAEARGDWSIPTQQEIGREAAAILGIAPPISWKPEPVSLELESKEEDEDPVPPEKLVDEVSHSDLDGRPAAPFSPPETNLLLEGSWKVIGDSGSLWEVSRYVGNLWKCSCPVYAHKKVECKHILDIQRKLQKGAPEAISEAPPTKEPEPPRARMPPPGIAPVFKPAGGGNTKLPEGGLMIGGGLPPTPKQEDPWALPPTAPPLNERVIPVGGKIQFKR